MPNSILRYLLYFAGILLLQTVVLDPIQLGRLVTPILYVLFVMVLPTNIKSWVVLLLCFGVGLIADFFSETGGMHAFSMVAAGYLRIYLLPLFISKEDAEKAIEPNLFTLGYRLFGFYAVSLSLVYLLVFTFLDVATTRGIIYTLLTIAISTAITVFLIFILQLLLYKIRPKEV